jgi:hypothetical protein
MAAKYPMLVGAVRPGNPGHDEPETFERLIAQRGHAAAWWSFDLDDSMRAALVAHPYLYLYVGQHGGPRPQRLRWRYRVADYRPKGVLRSRAMACPAEWEQYLHDDTLRGRTNAGTTRDKQFKTWFLFDQYKEPNVPLSALRELDGRREFNPSILTTRFSLCLLKAP